jgi:hypothetical protein
MDVKTFLGVCQTSIGSKVNPFETTFNVDHLDNKDSSSFIWNLFKDAYGLKTKLVDDSNVLFWVLSSHDDVHHFMLRFHGNTIKYEMAFV